MRAIIAAIAASIILVSPGFSQTIEPGIIVYRNTDGLGTMRQVYIDVNDVETCGLHKDSFFIIKYQKYQFTISSSIFGVPGTSRIVVKPQSGRTMYIRMETDKGKQGAQIFGGLGGALIAEGMSSKGGPFIFTLVDEAKAIEEIIGLDRDCQ